RLTVDGGHQNMYLSLQELCASGMTREYFLRIEEVSWNYAPSGMNIIQNITLLDIYV
uniref:Uncharacterized protein n=1 Tax=Cyclopterus lumpus TaxID=8103 RepID=A0A8C2ZQV7_CYCLU